MPRFDGTRVIAGNCIAANGQTGEDYPGRIKFEVWRTTMTGGLAMASMTLGGMVYVLWRPESLKMFAWFSALGLDRPVDALRTWAAAYAQAFPSWVYLSLPQALWLFSGCLAVYLIWRDAPYRQEQFWMAAVVLLAVGGELGQAAGVIQGAFDPMDLALIVLAFIAAQSIRLVDKRYRDTERIYA